MTIAEFQKSYGVQWTNLVTSPMWRDAAEVINSFTQTKNITGLSDEKIAVHASIILARKQGFEEHERLLGRLHTLKSFEFKDAPREDYPDPRSEFIESQQKSTATTK